MAHSNDAARRERIGEKDFWQIVEALIRTLRRECPGASIRADSEEYHVTISFPGEIPLARPAPLPEPEPPPPPPEPNAAGKPTGCAGHILDVLRRAGRRMTTTEILAALAASGHEYSDTTVKHTLAVLVDMQRIINQQQGNPRGYELS